MRGTVPTLWGSEQRQQAGFQGPGSSAASRRLGSPLPRTRQSSRSTRGTPGAWPLCPHQRDASACAAGRVTDTLNLRHDVETRGGRAPRSLSHSAKWRPGTVGTQQTDSPHGDGWWVGRPEADVRLWSLLSGKRGQDARAGGWGPCCVIGQGDSLRRKFESSANGQGSKPFSCLGTSVQAEARPAVKRPWGRPCPAQATRFSPTGEVRTSYFAFCPH